MNIAEMAVAWDPSKSIKTSWGTVSWLISDATMPGAEQTFGIVTIDVGCANPLHLHPNCEELLYVQSGSCEHRVGDESIVLEAGMVICIPRGTPHSARALGKDPLVVAVSFSSPDRKTINLEGGDIA